MRIVGSTAVAVMTALLLASTATAQTAGGSKFARMKDGGNVVTDAWAALKDRISGFEVTFSYDVWACGHDIPAGKVSEMPLQTRRELESVYGEGVSSQTLAVSIPASRRYAFTIRTMATPEYSDLIIDWGDGTETEIAKKGWSEGQNYHVNPAKNEVWYTLVHDYAADGVYTVRYIGKDWHAITHTISKSNGATFDESTGLYNLVCRVFDLNCPVPSHVKNFSSMFIGSKRILTVNGRYNYPVRFGNNVSSMFKDCKNLLSAGYLFYKSSSSTCASTFSGCGNLIEVLAPKIPPGKVDSIANMYSGCTKLELDIAKVVVYPFENETVAVENAFKNCRGFYGTVPATLLWEDNSVLWTPAALYLTNGVVNTSGPFYGCSDEIRAQVPPSWGGTNTAIKVPPYAGSKIGGGGSVHGGIADRECVQKLLDPVTITELGPDPEGECDYFVLCNSHAITTIDPQNVIETRGIELAIRSTTTRNMTLFFPLTDNLSNGLPITLHPPGRIVYPNGEGTNAVTRLPALVEVVSPNDDWQILKITYFDKGDAE